MEWLAQTWLLPFYDEGHLSRRIVINLQRAQAYGWVVSQEPDDQMSAPPVPGWYYRHFTTLRREGLWSYLPCAVWAPATQCFCGQLTVEVP